MLRLSGLDLAASFHAALAAASRSFSLLVSPPPDFFNRSWYAPNHSSHSTMPLWLRDWSRDMNLRKLSRIALIK